MSRHLQAHLALFITAIIYGANYTVAKEILDNGYVHPFALTLMRVLAGVFLFTLFHHFFIKEKIEWKDTGLLLLCGITGVAANQLFFITGLKFTTHINAALIMTTTPILVIVSSWVILKEPVTLKKLFGIALGMAGAAALTLYGKKFAYQKEGVLGDILIFANALSYGIYLVLVKSLMTRYHPLTVTKWVFIFGLPFVLPFGFHELTSTPMNIFSPRIWMAIAYVLICTTFLAYLLNAFALKLVQPSTVSIYIYLQPLIATAIALSLGKDNLSLTKVVAGMMIFLGVFLVGKK